jgi:anti-sigma regulatory factor (Ser/Thr protein kinase)
VAAPEAVRRELPPHPTAARAARDLLAGVLLDWGAPKALAAGSLIMSELVTNAMLYARTDIRVSVARAPRLVRIAVRDGDTALPAQRHSPLESMHGRGLQIVDGFARDWGVLPCAAGGKVVWAVVDG